MKKVLVLLGLFFIVVSCSKEDIEVVVELPILEDTSYKVLDEVNYKLPSYFTRIPFPEQVTRYRGFSNWHPPLEAVVLDYDKDGYLDIVETQSLYGTYTRSKIRFMKGTSQGDLELDTNLSNKYEGLIHGRKGITGDFNNDGWPDILFIGHGYDIWDGTFPNEEYPILLLNLNGKDFEYVPLKDLVAFFHTGTSGDIDNDGDLDIILIDGANGPMKSYVLLNNGDATFTTTTLGRYEKIVPSLLTYFRGKFSSELIDLDNNGYLDLVLAGHEYEQGNTPPLVIYGSAQGFTETLSFPVDSTYGIVNDIDFKDLNNDGTMEVIMTRTKSEPFYQSFKITIYSNKGEDLTNVYFSDNSNIGKLTEKWIYWLSIIDRNGYTYLRGDDMVSTPIWMLVDGKFIRQ